METLYCFLIFPLLDVSWNKSILRCYILNQQYVKHFRAFASKPYLPYISTNTFPRTLHVSRKPSLTICAWISWFSSIIPVTLLDVFKMEMHVVVSLQMLRCFQVVTSGETPLDCICSKQLRASSPSSFWIYPFSIALRLPQTYISPKPLLNTIQKGFLAVPCRWSPHELPFPYQLLVHGYMTHVGRGKTQRGGWYLLKVYTY